MEKQPIRELLHDVNQPLCSILMNAKAAMHFLEGDAPDLIEVRNILTDILLEAEKASVLVRGIKDIVKQDEHRR